MAAGVCNSHSRISGPNQHNATPILPLTISTKLRPQRILGYVIDLHMAHEGPFSGPLYEDVMWRAQNLVLQLDA